MDYSSFPRCRDSPAILRPEDFVAHSFFQLHECVTVFEDRDHELMRLSRGHFFKATLPFQISLFEED